MEEVTMDDIRVEITNTDYWSENISNVSDSYNSIRHSENERYSDLHFFDVSYATEFTNKAGGNYHFEVYIFADIEKRTIYFSMGTGYYRTIKFEPHLEFIYGIEKIAKEFGYTAQLMPDYLKVLKLLNRLDARDDMVNTRNNSYFRHDEEWFAEKYEEYKEASFYFDVFNGIDTPVEALNKKLIEIILSERNPLNILFLKSTVSDEDFERFIRIKLQDDTHCGHRSIELLILYGDQKIIKKLLEGEFKNYGR
jgi:hypothetical protein